MGLHERWLKLVHEIREGGATKARYDLAAAILIGPYDDRGIAEPGKEHGPGFAIFIGEWRIGWWKEHHEACLEADKLADAIRHYPVELGTGDA